MHSAEGATELQQISEKHFLITVSQVQVES